MCLPYWRECSEFRRWQREFTRQAALKGHREQWIEARAAVASRTKQETDLPSGSPAYNLVNGRMVGEAVRNSTCALGIT